LIGDGEGDESEDISPWSAGVNGVMEQWSGGRMEGWKNGKMERSLAIW
jgi:hypothetical protein